MFDYETAFSRNYGWVSRQEQAALREKKVAIAGLGGVGGSHLLTMTRLGIGKFAIADFDTFDLPNFNRQAGALVSTLGKPKVEVLARMARDINPTAEIVTFADGVTADNVDEFLDDVDVYVDSLDFFAFEARELVFPQCRKRGIPALTAAPLGTGVSFLAFMPDGKSFEDYFGFAGQDDIGKALRFLLGLAPRRLHAGYLVRPDAVDLADRKGPSTPMAIDMCAGMMATQVMKLLVGRGNVPAVPIGLQFDPFVNRAAKFRNYLGYRNPLQRLGYTIGRRDIERRLALEDAQAAAEQTTPAMRVLELARWAPSGDNQQPWRFRVDAPDAFEAVAVVEPDFFNYKGRGTLISFGALLESIDLGAAELGFAAEIDTRTTDAPVSARAAVRLTETEAPAPGLAAYLSRRSVYRYAMKPADLNNKLKAALADAIAPDYEVRWIEDGPDRRQLAAAIWKAADVRFRSPEAHKVHVEVIDWDKDLSRDRIPGGASGMSRPMRAMVRRMLPNWRLLDFMNRYAGGTVSIRLATEYFPFLRSNGAAVLLAPAPLKEPGDFIDLGQRVQRFWLTATEFSLALQPLYMPLLLRTYVADGVRHTDNDDLWRRTVRAAEAFDRTFGVDAARVAFLFRVGADPGIRVARSIRQPLSELLAPSVPQTNAAAG